MRDPASNPGQSATFIPESIESCPDVPWPTVKTCTAKQIVTVMKPAIQARIENVFDLDVFVVSFAELLSNGTLAELEAIYLPCGFCQVVLAVSYDPRIRAVD